MAKLKILCNTFLVFTIIFMTYACKQDVKKEFQPNLSKKTSNLFIEELERDDSMESDAKAISISPETNIEEVECIFDQSTQTDEFLKGIKELENYIWDAQTKTAEIILNDHWDLTIKRGGCDHFSFEATFTYDKFIDFEENKELVFDKIVWLSNLLDDLDGEILAECIKENKLTIEPEDNKRHIHFMDVRIYELYYMLFSTLEENSSYFSISYYIN